ncbi:MAG: ABC transporter ATP-binding protein [Clostridiales Family XIII bacterium]|jgi:branched-chain amino acid transport system ATP-binding protein|nr:ABC transporter ATP-binding protein [Clostridiales Family XIII bacterium]
MRDALLTVDGLNVYYGDFQVLYDLSMQFPKGAIVSIIGSNGEGKSTLLNTIMGVNKAQSGRVIFEDKDILGLRTCNIVSMGISLSPEGSSVFEDMSVYENLVLGAFLPGPRKKLNSLLERAYELFPALKEKANQLATFLSGGQRQMLAIARALMSEPRLLICDEISLGLAPVVVNDIYNRILEVNETGVTVVLVEQEVKRSLDYSDYSYVLVKGRVVMGGPSGELDEKEVKDAYFGINQYA